jgi:hypothetical protein
MYDHPRPMEPNGPLLRQTCLSPKWPHYSIVSLMQFAISRWSNTIEFFPAQQTVCHIDGKSYLHYTIVTCPLQHLAPLRSVLRALREELALKRTRNRFKFPCAHELLPFCLTDSAVEGNSLHCNPTVGCQCEIITPLSAGAGHTWSLPSIPTGRRPLHILFPLESGSRARSQRPPSPGAAPPPRWRTSCGSLRCPIVDAPAAATR